METGKSDTKGDTKNHSKNNPIFSMIYNKSARLNARPENEKQINKWSSPISKKQSM